MPNWITNKVEAAEHVIRAMINAKGEIDFNTIAPFPGPNDDWDGICCDAEMAAEMLCGIPVSTNQLLAVLQESNRNRFDIKKMTDESFRQMIGMLENYRACGHLHSMGFARRVWGTKWNACRQSAEPELGKCEFDTAWACPVELLKLLSEKFPAEPINVTYADEDIGSNCGTFVLKAGKTIESNIAPKWGSMGDADKVKWKEFSRQVKGWEPDECDDSDDGAV